MKRFVSYTLGLAIFFIHQVSVAQFEELTQWIPDNANSLVLVRAKRIFDSELAKAENWKKEHTKAFESGAAFLPATIERIAIGAEIDLETMQPLWKVSVFEKYGTAFNLATISERVGGIIESLSGHTAVIVPHDTYILEIDEKTVAAMTPANRQSTARWLATKGRATTLLSPYLEQAIQNADKNADMILAIDLGHVFCGTEVERQLKMNGVVMDGEVKPAADVVSTIHGLTLGITVRDKIIGSMVIDFGADAAALKKNGKQLLIDALERRGTMIDEFEGWNVEQSGNQLKLSGALSPAGFRRILSVVRHSIQNDVVFSGEGEAARETDIRTKSKQYFNKLETIVDELRAKEKGRALNTYATWYERYAHEIDEMSVRGIDEDLERFGQYMADSFRDISDVLRGHQLARKADLVGTADTVHGYRYNAFRSYFHQNDRSRERRQIATRHEVAAEKEARDILGEVQKQMSELRRSLSQIYKINF